MAPIEFHVLHLCACHPIGAILREHLSHSGPSWPFALACWSLLVLLAATFASPGINSFHSRKNSPSDDTIMLGPHKSCKLRISCRSPEKCFFFQSCALEASYADTNWVQSAFIFKLLFSERTVLATTIKVFQKYLILCA